MNKFDSFFDDVRFEQILVYFNFFEIEKDTSFTVFKNSKNVFIIAFNDENGGVRFLESTSFLIFNKKELLLFLIKEFSIDYLNSIIEGLISIEVTPILFSEKTNISKIKNMFLALEKSNYLKDTPIEKSIFKRYDRDCLLFNSKGDFLDLILFDIDDTFVHSSFGNNTGFMFNDNSNSDELLITYNPSFLDLNSFDKYSLLITKYYIPISDIISVIQKRKFKKIVFFEKDDYSLFYKLRILTGLYNIAQREVILDINLFPNNFFININYIYYSDELIKLTQFIANIQNGLKLFFNEKQDYIKEFYKAYYKPKFDYTLCNGYYTGKIIIRNNTTIINGVTKILLNDINNTFGVTFD